MPTAFNLLTLGSLVAAARDVPVCAEATGDVEAAFIGGLLFGFNPFMTARVTAHFSLGGAAPDLRTGALRNLPAADDPAGRDRRGGGGVGVPLRSVLCRLLPVDGHVRRQYSLVAVERRPLSVQRVWWRTAFNLLLLWRD